MSGFDINQIMQGIAVGAIPVLFAITLHEVAHGLTARRFGDRTAEMLGRLSLNPIRHIDPVGTLCSCQRFCSHSVAFCSVGLSLYR